MRKLANRLKRHLPSRLKKTLRLFYCYSIDFAESILGLRDEFTPPRSKIFVGDASFRKPGEEFLRYFLELGGLKPDERVLDVGCGIGRMAVPLTRYLSPRGEYRGFDIVKEGIDWCQGRISPKFPNFHFQLLDIYNRNYNPGGTLRAHECRFPCETGYFDFVLLTSVFTHMLPADMENYFSEIARVLKRGGRCLITFFLLNAGSRSLIASGESKLDFRYEIDGTLTVDERTPEAAVAYDENRIRMTHEKYGLRITEPIRFGSWCGRRHYLSYQDIVVAVKI